MVHIFTLISIIKLKKSEKEIVHINNATLYNLLSPQTCISNCAENEAGHKLYLSKNHL